MATRTFHDRVSDYMVGHPQRATSKGGRLCPLPAPVRKR